MASTKTPDPPIPLGVTALGRWRELYAANAARGRGAWKQDLAAYCAAWGRWYDAEAVLAESADAAILVVRDDKGNVKSVGQAPEIRIAADASKLCRELARGLTVV